MGDSKFEGTEEEWDALVQKERLSKMNFKKYKRKGLSEMVAVQEFVANGGDLSKVSISSPDHLLQTHNPEKFSKGFIARNPANHEDMWYVAKDYHETNLELAEEELKKPSKEETFLDRFIREEQELGEKIINLTKALNSEGFQEKVGTYQYNLLIIQQAAMVAYKHTLTMRIQALEY